MTIRVRNPDLYSSGGEASPWQAFLQHVASREFEQDDRFPAELEGDFIVAFQTARFAPSHAVTLRNEQDGWEHDVLGEYWDGSWFFRLHPSRYPRLVELTFAIDAMHPSTRRIEVRVEANQVQLFRDRDFPVPDVTPRIQHGFDNFAVSRSKLEQDLVPGNRNESIHYDVIVIGSGMGGGVVADAVTDFDCRTLVLEAGGLLYPTHVDSLPGPRSNFELASRHEVGHYRNRPGSTSNMVNSVQLNFGGRSVFWEGIAPRMADWELCNWPQQVRHDLMGRKGGYRRAEKLLRLQKSLGPFQDELTADLTREFSDFEIELFPRSLHQPNLNRRGRRVKNVLQRTTGTFSTADLLLDSLATEPFLNRDFLTVNLNHLVTELEHADGRVTGVVCWDLASQTRRVYRGERVVLAAGSLESPRIVMASQLTDPSGKVGKGLTDHAAFVQRQPVPLRSRSPYAGKTNHAKLLMRHRDGAMHPYSIELVLNPQFWDVRHSDDDILRLALGSTTGSYASIKFLFDAPLNDNNYLTYHGPGQKLEVYVEPELAAFVYADEVKQIRNRLFDFLDAEYDPDESMDYHCNGSVHHAGGTLRMSDNGTGVVNENLRFESYENLYCCDVSVFPHIPTANPSLTLVALAQRLAKELAIP